MSPEALEPKLAPLDLRVLGAIPPLVGWEAPEDAPSVWGIGERLGYLDVAELARILNGLQHLGYVQCSAYYDPKKRRYWRLAKGDEAVR